MILLLLAACNDYVVQKQDELDDPNKAPDIALTPDSATFDALAPGEVATATFTILNEGDEPLTLGRVLLSGSSAYTLLNSVDGSVLDPAASVTVDVAFSPANPEDRGELAVESDDLDEPVVTAQLLGAGLYPELRIFPTVYDFGGVLPGCYGDVPVTLSNVGTAPLTVTSVAAVGPGYSITLDAVVPFVVAPGADVGGTARFEPEGGEAAATLWVDSDDPRGPQSAAWTGHSTNGVSGDDEFVQGDEFFTQVDVDIFVDQSGSMDDDAANLAANFSVFFGALEDAGLDWLIMVTNNDDGCNSGGFFTADAPDATGFSRAVQAGGGNWTEAGLTVSALAMENAQGGCNDGFLREDAATMIVLVSDEPEQSRGSWSGYVDRILAVDPHAKIVSIVGDLPSGCGSAEPGSGYVEAAEATGGALLSICATDWGEYANSIATLSSSTMQASFVLTERPEPDSIEVTVDGAANGDWLYEPYGNAITFYTDRLPPPNSIIHVTYLLEGACER